MARRLGDDTAERAGRLTLNPIPHLDWVGSILVPAILLITKASFFIAWAKPVPYNPNNLSDQKYGELKVGVAGPITNFIIAIIAAIIARLVILPSGVKTQLAIGFLSGDNSGVLSLISGSFATSIALLALMICMVNLMLGFFNLIPIPPLDGSKVLYAILPQGGKEMMYRVEQYGFILLILLLMSGVFDFIFSFAFWIFALLTGLN